MEPNIIQKNEMKLVGCVSYGGDIHEIWNVFMKLEKKIKHANLNAGYEVHIFPADHDQTEKYHIFVGVEVDKVEDMPLEAFAKIIPPCTYAVFTHRLANGGYSGANKAIDNWIENSEYKMAYPFSIQCFDDRFKGGNQPDSEIDFYIPITLK